MHELWDQVTTILRNIWVNRKFIPIFGWLLAPALWLIIINLPDQYESKAQVFVDTQTQLKPLLEGLTVESDPDQQVRMIAKTLKSRPILEQVLEDSDLSLYVTNEKDFESYFKLLEKQLNVRSAKKENRFDLSFRFHDPIVAKKVLDSLIKIFVERTLGENRTEGNSAREFLQSQLDEYQSRLRAADQALTEFKRKNAGLLPDDGNSFQSQLAQEKRELAKAKLALQQYLTRLSSVRKQLANEPKYIAAPGSNAGITTQYDSRISQQEGLLDELSLKYTDRHPDVIELKHKITELKKLQQAEIARLKAGAKPVRSGEVNPLYQELKLAVSEYEADVASQRVQIESLTVKLAELELKKDLMPQVEAELLDLTRGYNITKNKFEELLARKETADLAQQAERNAQEIQFKIIDPPRVPTYPIGPKRLAYTLAAILASLGAGLALAFAINQVNPVVSNIRELERISGVPVFGIVSSTKKADHLQDKKRGNLGFSIAMILLLLLFAFMLASQLSSELDAIIEPLKFLRK